MLVFYRSEVFVAQTCGDIDAWRHDFFHLGVSSVGGGGPEEIRHSEAETLPLAFSRPGAAKPLSIDPRPEALKS